MANEIAKLLDFDIKEVERQTKIPLEYLEAIYAKNYDFLKDTNLKAYLRILSREFNIDLDGYLEDFENYCAENSNDDSKIQVNPRLTGYVAKESKSSFAWLVLVLILLGVGVWGFKFIKDLDFNWSDLKPDFGSKSEVNVSEENIAIIKPNTDVIENIVVDEVLDQNTSKEEILVVDENATTEQNLAEEQIKEQKEEVQAKQATANVIKIIPVTKVWIGIKNLKDMSKRSLSTSEAYELNATGNRLILTGNGMLDLVNGDNNKSYRTRDALRFHIHDGIIEEIDYAKYVKLNKGKTW
ncbi:MAG: helix-turn-helix domain-containing protein [Campylobacter sp.]|uniref:hypothetical protein n=1 Tax=Campylobacter sp. TaxID=205 RepID=UPI002AA70541|nr:hypothetical protein [Campylobacter sp.]MCI7015442.1 helix-turn-helix domain-containing protein [Campylobacter sp.]